MSDAIPEDYGFDHVVVADSGGHLPGKFHLAAAEDPDAPRCGQGLHKADAEWAREDVATLPWRYDICRRCDPTVETTGGVDVSDPDGVGEMTARQIRNAVQKGGEAAIFGGDEQ